MRGHARIFPGCPSRPATVGTLERPIASCFVGVSPPKARRRPMCSFIPLFDRILKEEREKLEFGGRKKRGGGPIGQSLIQ